ncbi:MAG TPA: CoA transferase, partial [Gammaproteobacteria bacterium]
ISIQNEREFRALCAEVLGQPGLPDDPRFASNVARCGHRAPLDAIIEARFTALPRAELLALLRSAKIAYGELNDVAGLSRHPVLRRVEVDTPSGPVRLAAPPQAGGGPLGPVPAIDAHGQAIREEFAA